MQGIKKHLDMNTSDIKHQTIINVPILILK